MTNEEFLTDLERRCKGKGIIVLADEMERLQNIGRTAQVPPPKPCIKRGVVLAEIAAARERMKKAEKKAA